MSEFLENELKEIKGVDYIVDIPIEEFRSISEMDEFVQKAKENEIGVVMHYETSNFHCGVVAQIYDKNHCKVKEFLDK